MNDFGMQPSSSSLQIRAYAQSLPEGRPPQRLINPSHGPRKHHKTILSRRHERTGIVKDLDDDSSFVVVAFVSRHFVRERSLKHQLLRRLDTPAQVPSEHPLTSLLKRKLLWWFGPDR
jgi:hypothetical protein